MPRGTPTRGAILRRCTALESLPDDLDVCYLDIRGCTRLLGWPQRTTGRVGRLLAAGYSSLIFCRLGLTFPASTLLTASLFKLPDGIR